MGTPVPPEWTDLEPTKWYRAHFDNYFHPLGPFNCEAPYLGRVDCCLLGSDINAWQAGGYECTVKTAKCSPFAYYQRLVSVSGPFNTQVACQIA